MDIKVDLKDLLIIMICLMSSVYSLVVSNKEMVMVNVLILLVFFTNFIYWDD